jgi:hypothetical protein
MSITDYKQTLKSVFAVILRVLTQILWTLLWIESLKLNLKLMNPKRTQKW